MTIMGISDRRSQTVVVGPKDIAPDKLVPIVAAHLEKMGFRRAFRSGTGTRYLSLPPLPFQIRIADHRWSSYSKMRQPQVVKSVALRAMPAKETYLFAVEIAIRFIVRCEARQRGGK